MCVQGNRLRLPAIAATTTAAATSTTTSAAATIAAISTAAAAARTTLGLRTRFINIQRATAQLRTVQCRDGFLSVFIAGHLNETEPTRATGLAIRKNAHAIDLSIGLEQLT